MGNFQQTKPNYKWGYLILLLAIWFLLSFWLGARKFFVTSPNKFPIHLLCSLLLPILIFLVAYWTVKPFRNFILTCDLPLLTALQAWRTAGIGFLSLFVYKLLPGYFAWPAAIGDLIIAISAPWVALALIRHPNFSKSNLFIAWNLFGILDFIVAVSMGAVFPSFVHHGISMEPINILPNSLIPTFFVPFFIIIHLIALFQSHDRRKKMTFTEH